MIPLMWKDIKYSFSLMWWVLTVQLWCRHVFHGRVSEECELSYMEYESGVVIKTIGKVYSMCCYDFCPKRKGVR